MSVGPHTFTAAVCSSLCTALHIGLLGYSLLCVSSLQDRVACVTLNWVLLPDFTPINLTTWRVNAVLVFCIFIITTFTMHHSISVPLDPDSKLTFSINHSHHISIAFSDGSLIFMTIAGLNCWLVFLLFFSFHLFLFDSSDRPSWFYQLLNCTALSLSFSRHRFGSGRNWRVLSGWVTENDPLTSHAVWKTIHQLTKTLIFIFYRIKAIRRLSSCTAMLRFNTVLNSGF